MVGVKLVVGVGVKPAVGVTDDVIVMVGVIVIVGVIVGVIVLVGVSVGVMLIVGVIDIGTPQLVTVLIVPLSSNVTAYLNDPSIINEYAPGLDIYVRVVKFVSL